MCNKKDKGRKIDDIYENPLDNLLYQLVIIPISPIFHSMGFTPNMLTFLSAMSQFYGIYCLQNNDYNMFSIFYYLGYVFDCFDGYIARRYNQVTSFGDMFDHVTDISAILLLLIVSFQKWGLHCNSIVYLFYACLILLFLTHMGCQQKMYFDKNKNKPEETLDLLIPLCPFEDSLLSKYFGTGTLVSMLSILPLFLKKCYD